jgi:hypothetical protein
MYNNLLLSTGGGFSRQSLWLKPIRPTGTRAEQGKAAQSLSTRKGGLGKVTAQREKTLAWGSEE